MWQLKRRFDGRGGAVWSQAAAVLWTDRIVVPTEGGDLEQDGKKIAALGG